VNVPTIARPFSVAPVRCERMAIGASVSYATTVDEAALAVEV
jgi:hypothetical protein